MSPDIQVFPREILELSDRNQQAYLIEKRVRKALVSWCDHRGKLRLEFTLLLNLHALCQDPSLLPRLAGAHVLQDEVTVGSIPIIMRAFQRM